MPQLSDEYDIFDIYKTQPVIFWIIKAVYEI